MKRLSTLLVCGLIFCFTLSNTAWAQDKTFTGLNGTDWHNSNNWDPDSEIPEASFNVIFDGTAVDACEMFLNGKCADLTITADFPFDITIDGVSLTCANLTIEAGYAGTIHIINGGSLICSGEAIIDGGTINVTDGSTITFSRTLEIEDANIIVDGIGSSLTFDDDILVHTDGIIRVGGRAVLNANSRFDMPGGHFFAEVSGVSAAELTFNDRIRMSAGASVDMAACPSIQAGNIELNQTGGGTFDWGSSGTALVTAGNITIGNAASSMNVNTALIDDMNNLTVSSGSLTFGAGGSMRNIGTVTHSGGNINLTNGANFQTTAYAINNASATFTGGACEVEHTLLTLTAGTYNASSEVTFIRGNIVRTGATFNHNNGSVTWIANGAHLTCAAGVSFNNLTVQNSSDAADRNFTFSGATTTINGDLTLLAPLNKKVSLLNGTLNVSGDFVTENYSGSGTGTHTASVSLVGNSLQTINGLANKGLGRLPSITINQSSGGSILLNNNISIEGNFTVVATDRDAFDASGSELVFYGSSRALDAEVAAGTLLLGGVDIGGASTASVSLTSNISVNGLLNIASASSLTTSNNAMELQGNVVTNGSGIINFGTSAITLSGDVAQSIDFRGTTTQTIRSLTCAKSSQTATISAAINISELLTASSGTLDLNNNVTLLSTASRTAQVGNSAGTLTGNVTVQRFIPAPGNNNKRWKFVASPVNGVSILNSWQNGNTGVHISGSGTGGNVCPSLSQHTNGFDATISNEPSMFAFNPSTQAWVAITNTNATNLATGTGYRLFVRGNRAQGCSLLDGSVVTPGAVTLNATGTLATGTQILSFTSAGANQWGLFGNPFQATINWDNISRTNIANAIYIYNSTNGGTPVWGTYINGVSTSGATNLISPGQAFHVAAQAAGTVSITIEEQDKATTTDGAALFKSGNQAEYFNLKLFSGSGAQGDDIALRFDNQATDQFDANFDARKYNFPNEGYIAFFNNASTAKYAIYSVTKPTTDVDSAFIHLRLPASNGNWSFQVDGISRVNSDVQVFILDKFTNTLQNLRTNPNISFSTTTDPNSVGTNRFVIVFAPSESLPAELAYVKATKNNNAVKIEWATSSEINTEKFVVERSFDNVSFEEVGNVKTVGKANITSQYALLDEKADFGGLNYYRIKTVDFDSKYQYSATVTVDYSTANKLGNITVYPVPAATSINVDLAPVAGDVDLNIYNITGVLVQSIKATGGSVKEISINDLPKGVYFLQVSSQGEKIHTGKFIKQ